MPPSSGTCAASQAQWAIGRAATSEVLEQARIDASAAIARFLRPNQPITTEYSGARLNLYVNAKDVVEGVVCG
ncbi:MAG: I78 family peptidase inhibitor [Vicinamibacterales bacterium]